MTSYGVPQEAMVSLILDPATNKPIDPKTLRKHFEGEIQRAMVSVNLKIVRGLFTNATTATAAFPGGNPTAQIFWLKTRMNQIFSQNAEGGGGTGIPPARIDPADAAKRVLFFLQANAQAAAKTKPKKKVPALPEK